MAKGVPATHPEERQALNWSPKKNWVEKAGGLPAYVNSVAVALVRGGMPRERAIPAAVNVIKKTCATGLWGGRPNAKVSPAIRAAACKAAAEWEAKKGGSDLSAAVCPRCSLDLAARGASAVVSTRGQQPVATNALAGKLRAAHLRRLATANANLARAGMPKGKRRMVMRTMARRMRAGR